MKSLKVTWNRILVRKQQCKHIGENGECTIKFFQTGPDCDEYEVCWKICEDFEPEEERV